MASFIQVERTEEEWYGIERACADFVPYAPPKTDDLRELTDELARVREVYGFGSQSLACFHALQAAAVRKGKSIDQVAFKVAPRENLTERPQEEKGFEGEVVRASESRRFSDQHIIGSLQVMHMRTGVVPSMEDWRDQKKRPNATVVIKRFGSWNTVIRAAGLSEAA